MDLQSCENLTSKVRKLLKQVEGVLMTTIDSERGLIMISGIVEPPVLIKTIEAKIGQTPQLYGYEKDPEKAKIQFCSLLKRHKTIEPKKEPPEKATPTEETCSVGGDTFRGFGYPGQPGMMYTGHPGIQMPMYTLPQTFGPPGCLMPGPRPRSVVTFKPPEASVKGAPAPYPFNFYETSSYPKTDSKFRMFSDDHAQPPCTIM